MPYRFLILSAGAILLFPVLALTQIQLPLAGYYRPGRCMPLEVEKINQPTIVRPEGGISMEIQTSRRSIVPFFILSPGATVLHAGDHDIPLQPLAPDERLVVSMSIVDPNSSAQLFAAQKVIPISIDASSFVVGAKAWESADAIVFDHHPEEHLLTELLANGTTVAVRSPNRPDGNWPWKRIGEFWVLHIEIAGPSSAIGGEAAYFPLQAWQPLQSASFRRQILLAGIVVSLLMMAALLIRGRRASTVALVVVAGLSCGAIAIWRTNQPAVRSAGGEIEVFKDGCVQRDTWRYLAAGAGGAQGQLAADDQPIVMDAEHASFIKLRMECGLDGLLRWAYDLPPNARLAVLHRTIERSPMPDALSPTIQSPLHEMARQCYLGHDMRIVGEIPYSNEADSDLAAWPTVVMVR